MSFALDLKRFGAKTIDDQRLVMRRVALEILRRVVMRTPVGNPTNWKSRAPRGYVGGFARANWQVSISSPGVGEIDQFDANGEATILEGANTIQSWDGSDAIFIFNNAPYIMRLEYGWSVTQAPQGMVRLTLEEYPDIVRQEA